MIRKIAKKYEIFLMLLMGTICLCFQTKIYDFFPFLFGIFMLERGVHGCVEGWEKGDFYERDSMKMETSMLIIALSLGIMIRQKEALIVATIFWGIAGVYKSSKYLDELFYEIAHRGKIQIRICFAFFMEFILSLILIFEPLDSVEHHILILGIQMIVEALLTLFVKTKKHIKKRKKSGGIVPEDK